MGATLGKMIGARVPVELGGVTVGGFGPSELVGGAAFVGVAAEAVVSVAPPDPALHPPSNHHFLLFEAVLFGFGIGALYVVSRALSHHHKRRPP